MRAIRFAGIAVTAAASAIFVASAIGQDSTPTVPSPAPVSSTSAVAAVPSMVTDNFALFRERPASPIPSPIAEQMASSARFGRNAKLARAIETPAGTGWVIPGDGYLCIVVPDPIDGYGESCNPTDYAVQHGLWLRLQGDHPNARAIDTLLVPDGASVSGQSSGKTTAATLGVVLRDGVASDSRPEVATIK